MEWFNHLGLKAKFALFTALIVVIIFGTLFFFVELIFRGYLRSEMKQQAGEIAESLQDQLANFYDPSRVQLTAERLLTDSRELSRIAVYRRQGNVMRLFIQAEATDLPNNTHLYSSAVSSKSPFRFEFKYHDKEYWEFAYPILMNDRIEGLTAITLNFSQYKALISALTTGTLLILIAGLLTMWLSMNVYVDFTISKPLEKIVAAMEKVKLSRFDQRVEIPWQDEIGKLAQDFNLMTTSLGQAQEEIRRQNRILEERVKAATAQLRSQNLELLRAQNEIRRASRLAAAGQVAAMLAHDLGSPLSSISGHLQLMLEDPERNSLEKERLFLLLGQVERLSETIRSFLKDVRTPDYHFQSCNLNDILKHLIELTSPLLTERKICTVLQLQDTLPQIQGDPNQLHQLFLNLVTNAMDAMQSGGTLTISSALLSEENSPRILVQIQDTGPGMDAEHLRNLFQPFFSTKEFGKGTGLGLAICKEIINAHGGEISVESESGKGTNFSLSFPLPLDS